MRTFKLTYEHFILSGARCKWVLILLQVELLDALVKCKILQELGRLEVGLTFFLISLGEIELLELLVLHASIHMHLCYEFLPVFGPKEGDLRCTDLKLRHIRDRKNGNWVLQVL